MKKYLVEFIGTFFLVLTIGMTVIGRDPNNYLPALAIGSALMVMIYAGGHISGAHYNPAVTFAVWLRGRCAAADVPGYIVAQVLGAAAASFLTLYFKGNPVVIPANRDVVPVLIAEFVGTFALAYVVLNVATAKATAGNSYYGLAIGFTVLAMAFALSNISGGVFNPAVATGTVLMGLTKPANFWIYLVGNFGGGALATAAFKFVNPDDK